MTDPKNVLEVAMTCPNPDQGLDMLYDYIDDLLLSGKFDKVKTIIEEFDPSYAPNWFIIGVITITFNARPKFFKEYVAMLARAAFSLEMREGPERATLLLKGLL